MKCCTKESAWHPPPKDPPPQECSPSEGVTGWCQDVSTCTGETHSGHCPGPSSVKCCTGGTPPVIEDTDDNQGGQETGGGVGAGAGSGTGGSISHYYNKAKEVVSGYYDAAVNWWNSSSSNGNDTPQSPDTPSNEDNQSQKKALPNAIGVVESREYAPTTAHRWLFDTAPEQTTICYTGSDGRVHQEPGTPIATSSSCNARKFLAGRSNNRYHSGIDLYAETGSKVYATEPGTVVNAYHFYENVCCVIVQTDSGVVINYGEISCKANESDECGHRKYCGAMTVGQKVSAGDVIGTVGDLDCCHSMIHFETYKKGTTSNKRSYKGNFADELLDPTKYVLDMAGFQT